MELQDLLDLLKTYDINGNKNYGVYVPQNTQFEMVPQKSIDGNAGVVSPLRPNVAKIAQEVPGGMYPALDTLFHEAAHTAQPMGWDNLKGLLGGDALKKNEFYDYDWKNPNPPGSEQLATLRAKEAMTQTGKTIWDTDLGKEYLKETMKNNPRLSEDGAKRWVEHKMFPEHSLLSDGRDFQKGSPSLLDRILKLLE
jgi:hypothetical protein